LLYFLQLIVKIYGEEIDNFFAVIFALILSVFFGVIVSTTIGCYLSVKQYSFDVPLIQIKTVNGASGNFFLGTGNITNIIFGLHYQHQILQMVQIIIVQHSPFHKIQ
jgi:hypothetical protein